MNQAEKFKVITAPESLKAITKDLMQREQLRHIKPVFRVKYLVLIVTIIVMLVALSGFTYSLFSGIDGDDLKLTSTYKGDGIIIVSIENQSKKFLKLQDKVKLMRWNDSVEIVPKGGVKAIIDSPIIMPNSSGKLTIDLSQAYDIGELEKPLTNDSYYLVLTNNSFAHGQDWQCTVKFADMIKVEEEVIPLVVDTEKISAMEDSFKEYYQNSVNTDGSREKYLVSYQDIIDTFDGNIVSSFTPEPNELYFYSFYGDTSPVFDEAVPKDRQDIECIGYFTESYLNGLSLEGLKFISGDDDNFLKINVSIPHKTYKDSLLALPLFFIATYDKSQLVSGDNYAIIMGQIVKLDDMADNKIYEDENYLCYDISSFIYTDLNQHIESSIKSEPNAVFNEQLEIRVHNVYNYFKGNLDKIVSKHKPISP